MADEINPVQYSRFTRALDFIADEIDPRMDFSRYPIQNIRNLKNIHELFEVQRQNVLSSTLGVLRSSIRGAVIGGIAGAIYSLATGEEVKNSITYGTIIGFVLDSHIFLIRSLVDYIRSQKFE